MRTTASALQCGGTGFGEPPTVAADSLLRRVYSWSWDTQPFFCGFFTGTPTFPQAARLRWLGSRIVMHPRTLKVETAPEAMSRSRAASGVTDE
ncbi:hypothetical protein ACIGW8_20140 [Streptomyces sioyaensis]|uniref:hypothetical protein n=1 Tax=Streptomyces sioyaensis TaxID=67364 RepID=UPI0037CF8D73